MPFEQFEKGKFRNPRDTYPFATLPEKPMPRIYFSIPCTDWLKANSVKQVIFLYDKESQLIAFEKAESGYKLQIRGPQAYFSARLFLEHIGHPAHGRYSVTFDAKNIRLVVDLKSKLKN